jgi:hypothetical protein
MVFLMRPAFHEPVDFATARGRLVVVRSTTHYSDLNEKCGAMISVVGIIRNDSDVPWEDVFVEVRHFDAAGTMIDADSAEQYRLVAPPRAEVAFRVRTQAIRPQADYATHRVSILSAKDARAPF